jgi:hypothetical protein
VDGMTGLVEEYLSQLHASLRTRPEETSWILAEAEDHLRESVAAGLRVGMTEAEAQEAAVSAFGSVRAVVRAHQTRRARAIAVLGGCAMTAWKLAGLSLLAFGASNLALLAEVTMTHPGLRLAPGVSAASLAGPALRGIAAGIAGLLILAGCRLVRRLRQRGTGAAPAPTSGYFPLAAVIFFGAGTTAQVLLMISGTHVGGLPVVATLALAIGYGVRMRWTPRPRRRDSQENGTSVPA